jgi:pyroglutamyl-peptidase
VAAPATLADVIVTGFEPFGGRAINRSLQVLERLGPLFERVRLPVEYARISELIPAVLARRPRALLLLGEASRANVTLERFARNACNRAHADNAGERRDVVEPGGPAALATTWNIDRALAAARTAVDAAISEDAGGYCCNAALYGALRADAGIPIGFVHVPVGDDPPLDDLAAAIEAIAATMR